MVGYGAWACRFRRRKSAVRERRIWSSGGARAPARARRDVVGVGFERILERRCVEPVVERPLKLRNREERSFVAIDGSGTKPFLIRPPAPSVEPSAAT